LQLLPKEFTADDSLIHNRMAVLLIYVIWQRIVLPLWFPHSSYYTITVGL